MLKRNAKKVSAALLLLLLILCVLAACANNSDVQETEGSASSIDYMVLVNKLNKLPDGWEDALETETFTNTVGDDVEVEKKAYEAYLALKEDLEKEDIHVDLDSARRSVETQQRIMDKFTKEYGEAYAIKTVAVPGYSEHHTGLALDLYLIIDGKDVVKNEDMIQYPEIWNEIHNKLAEHGFILRYLKDKEHITGYGYEPWHIRYIDDPQKAEDIMSRGITLEGYIGAVNETEVDIDYGQTELFTREELEEAAVQIKCQFALWEGCEMHTLRYAGDECNTDENIAWINSLSDGGKYFAVCKFVCDFHSPKENAGAMNPDEEYRNYEFWLGKNEDGDLDLVSWGY